MEKMFSPQMFSQLSDLFSASEAASGTQSWRDQAPQESTMKPSDLYGTAARIDDVPIPKPVSAANAGDIFDDDDVREHKRVVDTRPAPEYDIRFAQSVSANDAYLGLNPEKTSAASSCERIVVVVQLPKCEDRSELALDIKKNHIELRHKAYYLYAPLPEPVQEGKGSAQWDGDKKVLRIELLVDAAHRVLKMI